MRSETRVLFRSGCIVKCINNALLTCLNSMLTLFTDGVEITYDEGHQVGAHLHRRVEMILQ